MSTPNKILLSGEAEKFEAVVKSDTKPGELVELVGAKADGAEGSIQAHSGSTGDDVAALIAGIPNLDPYGPSGPHAAELSQVEGTLYADDQGEYLVLERGAVFYGWLGTPDTSGNGEGTIGAGDYVETDGNGALINTDSLSNPIAMAVEGAVNDNASDGDPVRAKFMVI